MTVYVLIQAGNAGTHWTSLFLRGISGEAKSRGMQLVEAESNGDTLPPEFLGAETVLAVGASFLWIDRTAKLLRSRGIRPILVGCANQNGLLASGFSVADYERATKDLLDYFFAQGRRRVALFGVSSDSSADLLKMKAFLRYRGGCFSYNDIFYFRGQTKNLCESMVTMVSRYDAVICANDVTGLMLMQTLKDAGIHIPDELFIAGFGDVTYRRNLPSKLTIATLDCVSAGRNAVDICSRIRRDPSLSYITIKMRCAIDVRESTANLPFEEAIDPPEQTPREEYDLFSDAPLTSIMLAEKIIAECDELDIEILRMLRAGRRNSDIAETLHASESTVKYRLKRLLNFAGLASRSELLSILSSHF